MPQNSIYHVLNILMAKQEFAGWSFENLLAPEVDVVSYDLSPQHDFSGALYVKKPVEKKPSWARLVESVAGIKVDEIANKSSSAVLLIRDQGSVFAFVFGHGRFLLNLAYFVQDFGLKTALNTLDHQSLRSVDLHTLEDQPLQRRSQSARGSEASVFGVDIFKDVLRAVTGKPRNGVPYKRISGGDAIFSFALDLSTNDLPSVARQVRSFYELDFYKKSFSWVDNIRKVKDRVAIAELDAEVVCAVVERSPDVVITLPEIISWDDVEGFSFTRLKSEVSPELDAQSYFSGVDPEAVSIDSIKRDKLFVTDVNGNEYSYPVYGCIYFEVEQEDARYILFGGQWYEVHKAFVEGIDAALSEIEVSDVTFPDVHAWEEGGKAKIEAEGDYNERAATGLGCYLLDRRLIKSSKTTSAIELCDLLTPDRKLIHVKHRKGGSAGLSHLFSQGGVSAEVLLGDREFRKAARKVLKRVHPDAPDVVPIDGVKGADYEVIFLILGEAGESVKRGLPFFSKVNFIRAFDNLSQRGFSVKVAGADKLHISAE